VEEKKPPSKQGKGTIPSTYRRETNQRKKGIERYILKGGETLSRKEGGEEKYFAISHSQTRKKKGDNLARGTPGGDGWVGTGEGVEEEKVLITRKVALLQEIRNRGHYIGWGRGKKKVKKKKTAGRVVLLKT